MSKVLKIRNILLEFNFDKDLDKSVNKINEILSIERNEMDIILHEIKVERERERNKIIDFTMLLDSIEASHCLDHQDPVPKENWYYFLASIIRDGDGNGYAIKYDEKRVKDYKKFVEEKKRRLR